MSSSKHFDLDNLNYTINSVNVAVDQIKNLPNDQIRDVMYKLTNQIHSYNEAYFMHNKSIVSDLEYDYKLKLLSILENEYSQYKSFDTPTERIGNSLNDNGLTRNQHMSPMLSIANAFSFIDVENFIQRIQKKIENNDFPILFLEPKIDGVSFSAVYQKGKLVRCLTRGDGITGEDITKNIQTIENFPLSIASDLTIEIRGEIYIDKADFYEFNNIQKQNNGQIFSNTRNFVSGSIRQLDSKVTASRKLKYFVYGVGYVSEDKVTYFRTQDNLLKMLKQYGFCINELSISAKSMNEIKHFYHRLENIRDTLKYEIDGLVYKVNHFALHEYIGFTSKYPKFMIAHKFSATEVETFIKNIHIQVGRTGILTPVAELKEVDINGVKVSRATLHNMQEIIRKDIRIGDYVILHRAGDVIPKITQVNLEKRNLSSSVKFHFPNKCPSCNSEIFFEPHYIMIRCLNILGCQAQLHQTIRHLVSKKALNISGLGSETIKDLLNAKLISNVFDIFTLERRQKNQEIDIRNLKNFGERSMKQLFDSIERAKNTSLHKFIYSLGVLGIGETTSVLIAKKCRDVDSFFNNMMYIANDDVEVINNFQAIDGIGSTLIQNIKAYFIIPRNQEIVRQFIQEFNIINDLYITNDRNDRILSGEKIVFTGLFKDKSRAENQSIARKLGADVLNTISKNVTMLVVGTNPGSKFEKAVNLEVKIVNEIEWYNIINGAE